jgi:hypothetical protein
MSLEKQKPGATLIPIILSSDKTLLTLFRGKTAYPVYFTIGNIPKDIRRKPSRRAQLLVGYIPTTRLEHMKNLTARRRALANLFHWCMDIILAPIKTYGETGIAMMSGDGVWRRCHPVLAAFVGDYPEQALVTCTYSGRCPKCTVPNDQLGDFIMFPLRDPGKAFETYALADGDATQFHAACRAVGLKPVYHPFWESLPFSNIFLSITPDILHQLLQGVMKHLVAWVKKPSVFGPEEIDARCRRLPPNHNITPFTKGITKLSRVSGQEHKNMCRILLGLIVDLRLPDGQSPVRLVRAIRALLDFLYLSQYPSHTTDTLSRLNDALSRFHDNKNVLVDLGTRAHFNFPKLHSLIHYASSITLYGTTDNYNTEQSERLHIDFAKDAYRATNRKDEYPQMTKWLERSEKIKCHAAYIQSQHKSDQHTKKPLAMGPPLARTYLIKLALHPSVNRVSYDDLAEKYRAIDFQDALADFIAACNPNAHSAASIRNRGAETLIPFRKVPVYHKVKFVANVSSCDGSKPEIVDAVLARPEQTDSQGRVVPARFDTVLVNSSSHGERTNSLKGKRFLSISKFRLSMHQADCRVAQVRVIFQIPSKAIEHIFQDAESDTGTLDPSKHLAYVEWFTPFSAQPDANHLMYRVSKSMRHGRYLTSIIPVEAFQRSVHLIPRFGHTTPRELSSFTVLEECSSFYVNPFSDRDFFLMIK